MAIVDNKFIKRVPKIYGLTKLRVEHDVDSISTIELTLACDPKYESHHLLDEKWDDLFPGDAIVKCSHCGQYAARKTSCKYCGAPVD